MGVLTAPTTTGRQAGRRWPRLCHQRFLHTKALTAARAGTAPTSLSVTFLGRFSPSGPTGGKWETAGRLNGIRSEGRGGGGRGVRWRAQTELQLFSCGARAAARVLTAAIDECVVFERGGRVFFCFFSGRHETGQGSEVPAGLCLILFSSS